MGIKQMANVEIMENEISRRVKKNKSERKMYAGHPGYNKWNLRMSAETGNRGMTVNGQK